MANIERATDESSIANDVRSQDVLNKMLRIKENA